jgi:hypothetical protein
MKYNESLKYNEPSASYSGTLIINVPGISAPIIVNAPAVFFADKADYNNTTVIGLVTIDSVSYSEMSITATEEQAMALTNATVIYIMPSASTSYEILNNQDFSTAEVSIISSGSSSELSLENLGI